MPTWHLIWETTLAFSLSARFCSFDEFQGSMRLSDALAGDSGMAFPTSLPEKQVVRDVVAIFEYRCCHPLMPGWKYDRPAGLDDMINGINEELQQKDNTEADRIAEAQLRLAWRLVVEEKAPVFLCCRQLWSFKAIFKLMAIGVGVSWRVIARSMLPDSKFMQVIGAAEKLLKSQLVISDCPTHRFTVFQLQEAAKWSGRFFTVLDWNPDEHELKEIKQLARSHQFQVVFPGDQVASIAPDKPESEAYE